MYNFCLFNQLATSPWSKSSMQNIMQEMDPFSGASHFKSSGWETDKFISSSSSMEKWLALFEKTTPMCIKVSETNWVVPVQSVEATWWRVCGRYMDNTWVTFISWILLGIWNCMCTVHKSNCSEIHAHYYSFVMLTLKRAIFSEAWLNFGGGLHFFKHTVSGFSACSVEVNRGLEYCVHLCWYRITVSLGLLARTIANSNITPISFSNVSSRDWEFTT